jgi:Flp pilus assembly protein TadB
VWWLVVTAGGVHLPFVVPVWAGLTFGLGGGLLPVLVLRSRANQARRSARQVVGSFLNLVVLCLAGGMGIEGALHESARIGGDDTSERILNALVLAQDTGEPPWDALDTLGRDLGIAELTELAAAVALAGAEGARIRMTLAAKAGSIRRHELADAETHANSVTERLFLPGVFLLVGFLVFIAYPAVARISSGL